MRKSCAQNCSLCRRATAPGLSLCDSCECAILRLREAQNEIDARSPPVRTRKKLLRSGDVSALVSEEELEALLQEYGSLRTLILPS